MPENYRNYGGFEKIKMNNWAAVKGSPLLARQNITRIAGFLLITGLILFILFLAAAFLTVLKSSKAAEWAEKKQKKITKLKNVNRIAQKLNLSSEERKNLWEMCKIHLVPNIEYYIHYPDKIIELFRRHYKYLIEKKASQETILNFFTLLYKMEQESYLSKEINSSRNIPEKTELFFTDKYGRKFPLKLLYHDKNVQYVQPSDSFMSMANKPKALDKITLLFFIFENVFYKMPVRVVRYQTATNGVFQMLISHSNDLERLNRRNSKRIKTNVKCVFSAVKVQNNVDSDETEFTPSEKKHEGILSDISGEGCAVITKLPIKEKQKIYLEFSLDSQQKANAYGIICSAEKKSLNETYMLHIKFIKISTEVKNRIFAYVYGFHS